MKVTISFNATKIVVPCGDGDITVREATNLAVTRYKKAIGKPGSFWVSVSSLKSNEGGMLDPDDLICDVCDDREQLMALFDEQPFAGHHGDGMSSSDSTSDRDPVENHGSSDFEANGQDLKTTLQVRRGSEPAINKGLSLENPTNGSTMASRSVQAVVASINALSSHQQHKNFIKNRSKTSLQDLLPSSKRKSSYNCENNLRSSLRMTMPNRQTDKSINIIHTSPEKQKYDVCSDKDDEANLDSLPDGTKSSLHVLRRKEPLGASANKPERPKSPKEEKKADSVIVPILKNSKSASNLVHSPSLTADQPSFEIAIPNEIGPLGIHVVPCDQDGRLVVQGIEPGGRIDRDGRLAVGDEIIRINGYPLEETSFDKAQEIFKEALFTKELRLRVVKGFHRRELPTAEGESDLNCSTGSGSYNGKAHTLPKTEKLAAGTVITTAVHANNTRKIGTVIPISLTKGPTGLGFSITTRDNALGGNTPIYIKNILPKGAAIEEGSLKPGDRLLEINEVCVDGMTQSDVVTLLRNAPQGSILNLVVSRHITATPGQKDDPKSPTKQKQIQFEGKCTEQVDQNNLKEVESQEPASMALSGSPVVSSDNYEDLPIEEFQQRWKQRKVLTFDIPVHDSERAGLGVSVKGETSNGKDGVVDLGIFVKSVLHGGAASRDGRLKTNDQLINIDGMSLLGKANPEAMENLRKAMHEEGPIPGVISLTVTRKNDDNSSQNLERRNSITSSDEDMIREYNVSSSQPVFKMPTHSSSQVSSLMGTRNPVVDRLMGKDNPSAGVVPSNLRNDSYYIATHHDTWNTSMIQTQLQQIVPSRGPEPALIEQQENVKSSSNTLNEDGEMTRESLTSLIEVPGFSRDQPGRQSMSEKRHATLDAKNTDTYQKRKKAREEREKQQRMEQQQRMWKKSASLESLHLQNQPEHEEIDRETLRSAYTRANSVGVSRNRGCNESFRAAVDRSYEERFQEGQQPHPVEQEHSGFVIEDLDSVVSSNDENQALNKPKPDVVMRRNKSADAKDRKNNRNSRLLTGLSNMFRTSGSKKTSQQVPEGSSGGRSDSSRTRKAGKPSPLGQQSQESSRTTPVSHSEYPATGGSQFSNSDEIQQQQQRRMLEQHQQQLRHQWYSHHMQLHQSKLQQHGYPPQHRSPQGKDQGNYDYLPSAVMRPGSRVGIADSTSSSDYGVLTRLKQQRPPPPPPPVHPYQHQMNMYPTQPNYGSSGSNQYQVYAGHPLPPQHQMGIPATNVHVRTSSNISSGSSGHNNPTTSSSSLPGKRRLRPKSNCYEYDFYNSNYGSGAPHAPHPNMVQKMVDRQGNINTQQQVYSLSRVQSTQPHYFKTTDYN